MTTLQAVILAIIQGVTEFLPVSSSGHMVLAKSLMGIEPEGVVWEVALHLGTLAAVILVFRKELFRVVTGFLGGLFGGFRHGWAAVWKERPDFRMGWYLLLGSVPAGAVGVLFHDRIEAFFQGPFAGAALIFVTGEILWLTRPHSLMPEGREVRLGDGFWIGVAQAIAILPGISRSGITISTGLLRGVKREAAARFSFLLSVPVILGAGAIEAVKLKDIPKEQLTTMGIGVGVSAVVGIIALSVLLRVVRAGRLHLFAWYCWAVSLVSLGYFWRVAVTAG
jgi:undecaprenyl-diphosphatase